VSAEAAAEDAPVTVAMLSVIGGTLVVVEIVRWIFRPESRRLRMIKKIRGRR
jgi:hypothetical protein